MHPYFEAQLAALQQQSVATLRQQYAELFGEPTRTGNKIWLIKRIAWRLQALAEGDLSQRPRQRAAALANEADLRLSPPRATMPAPVPAQDRTAASTAPRLDPRLPSPGTVLTRVYKGQTLQVRVLLDGLEYQGVRYPSLSAVAKAITGQHGNGFLFFGLTSKKGAST